MAEISVTACPKRDMHTAHWWQWVAGDSRYVCPGRDVLGPIETGKVAVPREAPWVFTPDGRVVG